MENSSISVISVCFQLCVRDSQIVKFGHPTPSSHRARLHGGKSSLTVSISIRFSSVCMLPGGGSMPARILSLALEKTAFKFLDDSVMMQTICDSVSSFSR